MNRYILLGTVLFRNYRQYLLTTGIIAPNSWYQWQQPEAARSQREQKNEAPVDKPMSIE